jgi:hypothetical protein
MPSPHSFSALREREREREEGYFMGTCGLSADL